MGTVLAIALVIYGLAAIMKAMSNPKFFWFVVFIFVWFLLGPLWSFLLVFFL